MANRKELRGRLFELKQRLYDQLSSDDIATLRDARDALNEPTDLSPRLTSDGAAVVGDYYWQPMDTCPRGVKVQLLTVGNVSVYGICRGGEGGFTGWAPLPRRRD